MRSGSYSYWKNLTVCLSYLLIFFSGPPRSLAENVDLLSLVQVSHRSARQSIHSLSASVTYELSFRKEPTTVETGKYWRLLNIVRIHAKHGDASEDYLLKDSEIRQVGRGRGPERGRIYYSADRKPSTAQFADMNVWILMLIDFPGPNGENYDFDRSLEFAQHPQAIRERVDGHEYVRLKFRDVSDTSVKQNVTLWHDVKHNYLVRKMTVTYENDPMQFEAEIVEFTEPEAGVIVPTKSRRQSFRKGERLSLEEITLSDVQVNKPIPKSVFQLPRVPAGTILKDEIEGKSYPIDENWRPIGPAQPYAVQRMAGKSDDAGTDYRSQSTSEARPLSAWIAPASLVLLITACVYLLYRHYRVHGRLFSRN